MAVEAVRMGVRMGHHIMNAAEQRQRCLLILLA